MKLIEALKGLKRLNEKMDDLEEKIANNCSHTSLEQPEYGDRQREKIDSWINSFHDTAKEVLRLRVAIQRTNLQTQVPIDIGDKTVTRSIAEWIHRRRDLAKREENMYRKLTDRHLRVGRVPSSREGGDPIEIKAVAYYDPDQRDKKINEFREEPGRIDSALEIVNATTDLIEE